MSEKRRPGKSGKTKLSVDCKKNNDGECSSIAKPVFVTDDLIEYGLYPQTHVSDQKLISELETLPESQALPNGYFEHNGEYFYRLKATPYLFEKKPLFDDGTPVVDGREYWFRCEPIRWKVLKNESAVCLVLSERLLDARRYNERYKDKKTRMDYQGYTAAAHANNYKFSEIRSWLNTDFYDMAFFQNDSCIIATTAKNSPQVYVFYDCFVCDDTSDKVFLLSYDDYLNGDYGFCSSFSNSSSRWGKTTDFARARGAYVRTCRMHRNNGIYWTRTPGHVYDGVCEVNFDGDIYYNDFLCYVNNSYYCVRPALTLEFK